MEVLASAGKCEENVVEINHFLPFFGEYLEMVISHLKVDVATAFNKDCACKIFARVRSQPLMF